MTFSPVYLPAGPPGEGDLRLLARVQIEQSTFATSVGALVKTPDPGLAAVGVAGVVGFVVNRRRREIGFRMASARPEATCTG